MNKFKNKRNRRNKVKKEKNNGETQIGVVIENLPNAMFRIEYENGNEEIAYLAGKMKLYKIRVLVGDKVEVKIDQYGGKGRIIKRLRM